MGRARKHGNDCGSFVYDTEVYSTCRNDSDDEEIADVVPAFLFNCLLFGMAWCAVWKWSDISQNDVRQDRLAIGISDDISADLAQWTSLHQSTP